jgi:hypothetical protein
LKNKATVNVWDLSISACNCSGTFGNNLKKSDIVDYFCCTPLCTNSSIPTLPIMEVTIHTPDIQKKIKTSIDSGSSLNLISKERLWLLPNELQKTSNKVITLKGANGERLEKATQLILKITILVNDSKKASRFTCLKDSTFL